jgi:hypothetical protein
VLIVVAVLGGIAAAWFWNRASADAARVASL